MLVGFENEPQYEGPQGKSVNLSFINLGIFQYFPYNLFMWKSQQDILVIEACSLPAVSISYPQSISQLILFTSSIFSFNYIQQINSLNFRFIDLLNLGAIYFLIFKNIEERVRIEPKRDYARKLKIFKYLEY